MKKLLLLSALAAAALSTTSVMAAETGRPHNKLDTQEVHGNYVHNARADRDAFQAARGTYAMDDGSTLWLYQDGARYVAEVSGQAPVEVTASKNGSFIAVNGSAEFRFQENAGGLIASVVLTKNKVG